MAILNITFAGQSRNAAEIDFATSDEDIKRVAEEIIRTEVPWRTMCIADAPFEHFVVDRFEDEVEAPRLYLRPKVPFG